jgi:hypothetical protein
VDGKYLHVVKAVVNSLLHFDQKAPALCHRLCHPIIRDGVVNLETAKAGRGRKSKQIKLTQQ